MHPPFTVIGSSRIFSANVSPMKGLCFSTLFILQYISSLINGHLEPSLGEREERVSIEADGGGDGAKMEGKETVWAMLSWGVRAPQWAALG